MLSSPRLLKRSSSSLIRYALRSGPLGIFAVGVVTLVNALLLYRSLQQQPTKSKANPADVPAARLQGQLDGRWAALHAAQVKRAASAPKWPALGGIRVLFLGDSITMGFANHPRWLDFEALGAANFGIGGDRTQHIAWRLANGLLDAHPPAVVVLMAGTNNLDSDDAAEVVRGVATILRLIAERWPAPATRVLLCSLFPRGVAADNVLRARTAAVNDGLRQLADDPAAFVTFFDAAALMPLSDDGSLDPAYTFDYVHLTPRQYGLYADALLPAVREQIS